jgi:hypothetical protein
MNGSAEQVIVDYTSTAGQTVTHARGTVLVNSLENLRTMGLFERYTAFLPTGERDEILYALAASWVPVQLIMTHYHACDRLGISEADIARAAELTSKRMSSTFFARAFRVARNGGMDAFPRVMAGCHRFFDRLYMGGGCTALRTGPKDMIVESHGLPFAGSLYFRAVYLSFFRLSAAMFCKSNLVRYVRARRPDPGTLAISCSWV